MFLCHAHVFPKQLNLYKLDHRCPCGIIGAGEIACAEVQMLIADRRAGGGSTAGWDDYSTNLEPCFAGLRMAANRVQLSILRCPQFNHRSTDPLRLLCCALRLAPERYRQFELAAARPNAPLQLEAEVWAGQADTKIPFRNVMSFDNVAELAAALRPSAIKEGLSVRLSANAQIVTLSRSS